MKVVSIWVHDPIGGWNEFTKEQYEQVSRKYTCTLELVNDVCITNGFYIRKVKLCATEGELGRCIKETFFVKTKLQCENPQMNQAEYEVRMILEVC